VTENSRQVGSFNGYLRVTLIIGRAVLTRSLSLRPGGKPPGAGVEPLKFFQALPCHDSCLRVAGGQGGRLGWATGGNLCIVSGSGSQLLLTAGHAARLRLKLLHVPAYQSCFVLLQSRDWCRGKKWRKMRGEFRVWLYHDMISMAQTCRWRVPISPGQPVLGRCACATGASQSQPVRSLSHRQHPVQTR
jgi:hypothetical protein